MLAVLSIVLPIFALIGVGWGARRCGALGAQATRELNRFVVLLALPALLFEIVAKARWAEIWQPGFVGALGIATFGLFAATVAWRVVRGRSLADAAVDGLNAGYANTAYLGFPLTLAVAGEAGRTPTLIATLLTVCLLFAVALVLIEIGLQTERSPLRLAGRVGLRVVRNPLVAAPLLGVPFLAFGIALPAPADRFLTLLGAAASPCALVALGLFLAEKREGPPPPRATIGWLAGLKLFAHPALTFVLAAWIFRLPPAATHMAVLLACLPTGTGPFMVAEYYGREARITASVVLVSTVLSLVTITVYLAVTGSAL